MQTIPNKPIAEELIDPHEVCVMLSGHVTPRTLAAWRKPGTAQPLPFVQIGRKCLYRRSDVHAYLAAAVTAPTSPGA